MRRRSIPRQLDQVGTVDLRLSTAERIQASVAE